MNLSTINEDLESIKEMVSKVHQMVVGKMSQQQKDHLRSSLARAERNGVHKKLTKDPAEALQFHTKKEAVAFSKLVGWQANDAIKRDIMGFIIWVISDPHLNFLTARGALRSLINRGINPN